MCLSSVPYRLLNAETVDMLAYDHLRFRVDFIRTGPTDEVPSLLRWQSKMSISVSERKRILETFGQIHAHEGNILFPIYVRCLEQNSLLLLCVGVLASCDFQVCTTAPVQLRSSCSCTHHLHYWPPNCITYTSKTWIRSVTPYVRNLEKVKLSP